MAKRKPRSHTVDPVLPDRPADTFAVSGDSTANQNLVFGAEPDKQGSGPEQQLHVAVIGDVMTDWAFISKEPARPRFPVFKPWTRDPATHLFALPAGAWFSGHMIQGALSGPVFSRKHSIEISTARDRSSAHVVLKAAVPVLADSDPPEGELVIVFDRDAVDSFDIIVNDEMVVSSKSVSPCICCCMVSSPPNLFWTKRTWNSP